QRSWQRRQAEELHHAATELGSEDKPRASHAGFKPRSYTTQQSSETSSTHASRKQRVPRRVMGSDSVVRATKWCLAPGCDHAEVTEKVRKMATDRQVTFKMYKRRGERDLKEKAKANKDGRKRRTRQRQWGLGQRDEEVAAVVSWVVQEKLNLSFNDEGCALVLGQIMARELVGSTHVTVMKRQNKRA
ncbi:hypothetical protein Dimus_003066, partial [Dionaea muscipula]